MIPAITEIGFGPGTDKAYATLHQATVSLQEMGDRTITTQVRIDGDVAPDFSGWELRFKGERFILPIKEPQAAKDNTTRNSLVDLTFTSWVVEELKRYFFFNVVTTATGTVVADKYKVPIALNLDNFVALFNNVLNYYFHGDIVMLLFGQNQGLYSSEPSLIEIDYTHIWDVLTEMFEIYKVRWYIEYNDAQSRYEIKVGYASPSITDHDFEYGYNGGLLKFERQVQDPQITNILLGRGGEKNLPYRYYKKIDEQNPDWAADPDAIPELANVNFDRIHDINFRWYIRGWVKNTHRSTAYDAGYTLPNYNESDAPAEFRWAYHKGRYEDTSFNPVEYVKDDASILKYGEHWGALDDNDDVYPTIQGVTLSGLGRVDETVAVSNITTDDIHAASQAAAETVNVDGAKLTKTITANQTTTITITGHEFSVPTGMVANATIVGEWIKSAMFGVTSSGNQNVKIEENDPVLDLITINTGSSRIRVYNKTSGQEMTVGAIPAGNYRYNLEISVTSANLASAGYYSVDLTVGCNGIRVVSSTADSDTWKPTFDIWVKNIWQTTQGGSETDAQYSERVWRPILGDRFGNEAKVVFSSGFMSVSEDYEFVIAAYPVVDRSKTITSGGQTYQSEWKITLYKSSAEYDATGLFVPNSTTGGKPAAGDYFYFIGIDMPHIYVEWAEELLNGATYNPTVNKTAALEKVADIAPTWVITFDKVRINTLEGQEYGTTLAERLASGAKINISDPRFTGGAALTLYVQSITYTWNEPSEGNPYLFPDIEVVLTDKVLPSESVISQIQGDIDIVKSTYAKATDIEQVVRRVAEPLFLKKTGEADSSASPTRFASKVSSNNFRQGDIGGAGWGHYEDGDGDAVLELDKLVVRKEMRVNSLVANQIAYIGGKQIISAASIECTQVVEDSTGYYCYFDQKQGSVKNLFVVGDIAYGQEFTADNVELRYYRMEVAAVGDNYIYLAKSGRDGSSEPAEGDVIVQYGNTSQTGRQYVIIRDVIGGGYERMLSGLNSTSAAGNEYYFAGKQNNAERWFVGNNSTEYAKWENGQLNIKGRLSVYKSDGSYQAMDAYITSVENSLNGLQSQIDGQIQSWSSGEAPSAQTEPLPKLINDVVDPTTANFPASDWDTDAKKEKHFGDIYVDDSTGQGYRYTKRVNNGVTEYYWVRITDEELAQALADIAALQTSVAGLAYLKDATNEGTLINGGLVLTSLIQLGQTVSGQYQVNAGINGLMNSGRTRQGGGIAAWYGGPMSDKDDLDQGISTYAKSVFRFDGSGYLANGGIHWDANGYGGIPGITWDSTGIKISNQLQIETSTGTFESLVSAVQKFAGMFTEETYTENNTTKYRLKVNTKYDGFYIDGWISAGGVSSGGGGGGGGTTVAWGTATSQYTPLTVGSDTRNLSLNGHKHTASDITDFTTAVQEIIGSSTSYEEFFASLQSQIDSVSARNSFDELLATVLNTDILTAQSIYGETLEVTGGAAIGGAASVGGLLTVGSIKLAAGTPTLTWDSTNSAWHLSGNFYVDGWLSAGGVSSGGGGGGGGTTVSWLTEIQTDSVDTIGLQVGSTPHFFYTKQGADAAFAVKSHTHTSADITDFNTAVAALIAGSDLATTVSTLNTTVSGHTTSINTLNGKFDANGKLLFANLPTLYWANVAVSDSSNPNTSPEFDTVTCGSIRLGQYKFDCDAGDGNGLTIFAYENNTSTPIISVAPNQGLDGLTWGAIFNDYYGDGMLLNSQSITFGSGAHLHFLGERSGSTGLSINNNGGWELGAELTAWNFISPMFNVDGASYITYDSNLTNSEFELLSGDDDGTYLAFGDSLPISGKTYGVFINDKYQDGVLINTPLLHLSAALTFTAEQSDSGNTFDKGLVYDSTNHAWHLKGNLYADGFISAGGLSSGGGGGESVVSWTTDIGTDTANVIGLQVGNESHFFYTKPWGDALDLRVQALEAGSALTITTTGSGNAVTDVSKSGTVITVTKSETFLTAASLDGAEAALASLQSQVDSVSARNSYDELSATVFNADIMTATTAYIESIVGSLTGNAATATKLAASKTINGKAFDGSSNIVTAYWGAERTITIKDNDGTNYRQNPNIDGSANFDLILPSTIKATLTGNATTATTLQTARSINGTSFNGSADITTAKWGTARTITVKDYTSTNSNANSNIDGSANFNLILPESLKVKNLAATGALSVAGVATMSGTLDVTGAVSLSSSFTVAGNSTLQGNLTVNGNTTLGNNAQSDTLNVNSITTIAGTVTTRSTLDVNLAANQTVPSSAAAKKLRVWGPSYFQGAITLSNGNKSVVLSISQDGYLEVDGDMYATGFISAGGVN